MSVVHSLKSWYNDDIRRFPLVNGIPTLLTLKAQLLHAYNLQALSPSQVLIKYVDDEDDCVTATSDADIREAFKIAVLQGRPILRVHLINKSRYQKSEDVVLASPVAAAAAASKPIASLPQQVASPRHHHTAESSASSSSGEVPASSAPREGEPGGRSTSSHYDDRRDASRPRNSRREERHDGDNDDRPRNSRQHDRREKSVTRREDRRGGEERQRDGDRHEDRRDGDRHEDRRNGNENGNGNGREKREGNNNNNRREKGRGGRDGQQREDRPRNENRRDKRPQSIKGVSAASSSGATPRAPSPHNRDDLMNAPLQPQSRAIHGNRYTDVKNEPQPLSPYNQVPRKFADADIPSYKDWNESSL